MHVLGYRVQTAVLVAAGVGAVAAVVAVAVLRGRGVERSRAAAVAALGWVLVVVAAVALAPDSGAPALGPCSFAVSLPALGEDQRLLNVALFLPVGFLAVVVARTRRVAAVVAVLALPVALEVLQRLPAVGRSCDADDVVDNWAGALAGVAVALVATRRRSP